MVFVFEYSTGVITTKDTLPESAVEQRRENSRQRKLIPGGDVNGM
jgi:hypothetical protein